MVTLKQILNEISSDDVFNKFYNEKIEKDLFDEIMSGQAKLTPFHRICLDYASNEKVDKEKPYIIADKISKIWPTASQEKKQYLIQMASDGEIQPNFESIISAIKEVDDMKYHTEAQMSAEGLITIYEDETSLATCTTTYASSTRKYSDSNWCTASDLNGRISGYDAFLDYISDGMGSYKDLVSGKVKDFQANGVLIQLVSKNHREDSMQICVCNEGRTIEEACDWEDGHISEYEVETKWDSFSQKPFKDLLRGINFEMLIEKTIENGEEEFKYMKRLIPKKLVAYQKKADSILNSTYFQEKMTKLVQDAESNGVSPMDDGDIKVYTYHYPRTQLNNKFTVFEAAITLEATFHGRFYANYGGEKSIFGVMTTKEGKIIAQTPILNNSFAFDALIYGVFFLVKYGGNPFLKYVFNCNTKEWLDITDDNVYLYYNGYLAIGNQIVYSIYNSYTGQMVVEKCFGITRNGYGQVFYFTDMGSTPKQELPRLQTSDVMQMTSLNERINNFK